jgi:hypothetical protein
MDWEGAVDTVYLGCWRKSRLIELGLFDEELVRNQDDELNLRIVRGGGMVYQSASIRSWYRPRSSPAALFRQYTQYGYWKVRVIQKHTIPASWRHMVPGAFVGGLIILTFLAPFSQIARLAWLLWVSAYLLGNALASLITCARPGQFRFLPVMPIVFAAFHFGYGYGFLRGVLDFCLFRRGADASFKTLTRGTPS